MANAEYLEMTSAHRQRVTLTSDHVGGSSFGMQSGDLTGAQQFVIVKAQHVRPPRILEPKRFTGHIGEIWIKCAAFINEAIVIFSSLDILAYQARADSARECAHKSCRSRPFTRVETRFV